MDKVYDIINEFKDGKIIETRIRKIYRNKILNSITYMTDYGRIHRDDDLPAIIHYHPNGKIHVKIWYKDNIPHRDNGKPAYKVYNEEGKLYHATWLLNEIPYREMSIPAYGIDEY